MEKLKNILFRNLTAKQIIFKNAFWLYVSEIFSKGLRILVLAVIIKILGPKNFGIFDYLISFIGLFFIFSDFGSSNIFIRDFQQKQDKEKQIYTFFWIKIILLTIFSLIASFGYFFSKKFDGFLFYLLFVILNFIMNFEGFFEVFFIAIQKTEKKFIFNSLTSISLLIFVFLGLVVYPNILSVIIAYILSALLGLITAVFLFLKEAKIKLYFDAQLIRYYLINGFPLVLFGILGYIFFATDKIILAHLRPIEEVGYYALASRILSVLFIVPSLFNTALYPYLAKKVSEDSFILKSLFKVVVVGSIMVGLVLAIGIFIFAPLLIRLFFGDKYFYSISILQSFIWIIIFVFPTIFLDYFLISNNKQWLDFIITLLPAILNIILNFTFIPQFGVFGTVYASIFAQFINFILTLIVSIFVLKNLNQK